MYINSLAHVSLVVASTERSLAFYKDILGLDVIPDRPALAYPGVWLAIGDQQLHLLEVSNPDPVEGRPAHVGRDRHLALYSHHLDDLIKELEANGISCTWSHSGRRAAFCRDPDGNGIEFIES